MRAYARIALLVTSTMLGWCRKQAWMETKASLDERRSMGEQKISVSSHCARLSPHLVNS